MPNSAPLRLFHVVENLDRGAVENWLVRMFLASRERYPQYQWTFYCSLNKPGRLDEVVRQAGGEIIWSPHEWGQPRNFYQHLRATLQQGQYDVLHCHHDVMSALYLWAAVGVPLKQRIVQVHNADLGLPTSSKLKTFLLHEPMRRTCLLLADQIVGISNHTLKYFVGRQPLNPRRHKVLYYGVDTSKFHQTRADREALRRRLNLSPDAHILLFAGRMNWFKNPLFVLQVLAALATFNTDAVAVFVGSGELEDEVKASAQHLGLAERVRVLGWYDDIPNLMQASDVFVFPRVEKRHDGVGPEGLGLVVVEAQAAGLPLLISQGVPQDAIVVPQMCRVLSLDAGPHVWAEVVQELMAAPRIVREIALQQVEDSAFSLRAGVDNLMALYAESSSR